MTPVNIAAKVRKERVAVSSAALADGALIMLLVMLASSRFVLAPGFSIDAGAKLPDAAAPDAALADSAIDVLNAKGKSMIIYDGEIFGVKTFAQKMSAKGAGKRNAVLLVKADKNVDAQTLLDICAAARAGGYKRIHLAASKSGD